MRQSYITILALVLILSSILQGSFVILTMQKMANTAVDGKVTSEGVVRICINRPPENLSWECPSYIREGVSVRCNFTGASSDGDNFTIAPLNFNDVPFYMNFTVGVNETYATITSYYNASSTNPVFKENYERLLGPWGFDIRIYESTICGFYQIIDSFQGTIYDVNDAPVFNGTLSDKTIPQGQSSFLFTLNKFFVDPERVALTYNNTNSGSIVITILGTSDVLAYTTSCEPETVTFSATDNGSLTTNSNSITITPACSSQQTTTTTSSASSGGGSGGGGGSFSSCISDWECEPWTACSQYGLRTKSCTDLNACNPNLFIYTIEETCNYIEPPVCEEIWDCSPWTECEPTNTQERNCTEINNCGTEEYKPALIQDCTYKPTCTDGIQNQNETGVDCGGPCLACSELQIPGIIQDGSNFLTSLIMALIIITVILLVVYKYFHKQINSAVVKLALIFAPGTRKLILLSDKDRITIMEKILQNEFKIGKQDIEELAVQASTIGREYFSMIFNCPKSFNVKDSKKYIHKVKAKEPLSNIFELMIDKIINVEQGKEKLDKISHHIFLEELRTLIHLTSRWDVHDIGKDLVEYKIQNDEPINTIRKELFNIYIAMHYDHQGMVQQKYAEILNQYQNLDEKLKDHIYSDLHRLFFEIKYFLSININ